MGLGLLLLAIQPPEEGEEEDGDIEVEGTWEERTNWLEKSKSFLAAVTISDIQRAYEDRKKEHDFYLNLGNLELQKNVVKL